MVGERAPRIMAGSIVQFARSRSGNVAVMFGLLLIPLLLAGGMAVDLGRAAQARAVVQEAADGAILRAARMKTMNPGATDADLTALARRIFDAATSKLKGVTIDDFAVAYDSASESFRLDFTGDLDTALLAAVGVPTLEIGSFSEVKLGKPPYLEVVLALDNTGSMNNSGKLQSLKDSASTLIESLFEHPDADVMVGLAPFAQYVNVGVAHKTASWMGTSSPVWLGCVGSRFYPANIEDANYTANPIPPIDPPAVCPTPLHPLSTNKAAMLAAIQAMTASGNTYIPSGLAWGWRLLSNAAPFSEGITYAELAQREGMKALILLTDGENTRAPSYPAHTSADRTLADSLTSQLCTAVKADGIVVYTIAFNVTDALIRDLLKQCGTTPAHFFEPDNATELADAFADIAASLRNLSLSK